MPWQPSRKERRDLVPRCEYFVDVGRHCAIEQPYVSFRMSRANSIRLMNRVIESV